METLREDAEYLRLSLSMGLLDEGAVIAWADRNLMVLEGPPVQLIDVSLAGDLPRDELMRLLAVIPGQADLTAVAYQVLGLLRERFESGAVTVEKAMDMLWAPLQFGFRHGGRTVRGARSLVLFGGCSRRICRPARGFHRRFPGILGPACNPVASRLIPARGPMAYSDFTIAELNRRFQLEIDEAGDLFAAVAEVDLPPTLSGTLARYLPLAVNVNTEKVRSELIIAPVLIEFKLLHRDRISLFSGIEFTVDEADGLGRAVRLHHGQEPLAAHSRCPGLHAGGGQEREHHGRHSAVPGGDGRRPAPQ